MTIRLRQDDLSARSQHAPHLLQDLDRLSKIINGTGTRYHIKAPVLAWQLRDLLISRSRCVNSVSCVFARSSRSFMPVPATRPRFQVLRVVRDPAAADVEDVCTCVRILHEVLSRRERGRAG